MAFKGQVLVSLHSSDATVGPISPVHLFLALSPWHTF